MKRIFGHTRTPKAQISLSDQDLQCPLKESLDTIEGINREQMHRRDFARGRNDSVQFAHAQRYIFTCGAAQLMFD